MKKMFTVLLIVMTLFSFSIVNAENELEKIGAIKNKKVALFAKKNKELGMYQNFILKIKNTKYPLQNWMNVLNPTYAPKLILSDINQDKKDELIIVLTKAYGTELYISEAHVFEQINTSIWKEREVENPIQYIKQKQHMKPNETIGSQIYFKVNRNKLQVNIPIQTSLNQFTKEFEITYKYKNEKYIIGKIKKINKKRPI